MERQLNHTDRYSGSQELHSEIHNLDLSAFQFEMRPIPERVEEAIKLGVRDDLSFPFSEASHILDSGHHPLEDGILRNPDGTLVVRCRTDMPDVTAHMIDWWFCWHTPHSERYNLWHPQAHVRSFVREDRTHLAGQKAGYMSLASHVDEYIGKNLAKLTIRFVEPLEVGLDSGRFPAAKVGTAICALAGLRDKPIDSGWLIHLIRETPDGVEMISRFWLGDVRLRIPLLGRLFHRKINSVSARIGEVPDQLGIDLLRHCAEEMNHLARFLPTLYRAALNCE